MNIRIALIVLFLLLLGAETAFAQFGRLRDRALDAAQRRVEQRIEERVYQEVDRAVYRAVDDAFDSVFGSPHQREDFGSEAEYEEAMNEWRKAIMAMGADVDTRDSYSFSVVNRMRISGTDEDGSPIEPVYFYSLIEPGSTYSGTFVPQEGNDQVTMVFDSETNAMIMFIQSDGEKMSMVYGGNAMFASFIGDYEEFEDEDFEPEDIPDHYAERFTEIGSKTINGIRATGYRMEDEAVSIEYWVTSEFGSQSASRGGLMQSPSTLMMPGIPQSHGGIVLEARVSDKETGAVFIMESVDINRNARRNYTKQEFPLVRLGE
ncbi:MAG: hypothetical protein JJU41_12580 [Bacteroidetes bacterium]|nr:hypothetical protein [Bacteroidota bacterium]MCH8523958.1 hypothetical protein [Balneolales bacterium]